VSPVTVDTDLLGSDFELEIAAYSVNAVVLTRAVGTRRLGAEEAARSVA